MSLSDKFRLIYPNDRTVSLLNALSERLPENTEKENVDLQSGDFDEAFRLLNAFDPRTYGTVQLGESLREEQTDTAKEHVGVLGLSDTALPGNDRRGQRRHRLLLPFGYR